MTDSLKKGYDEFLIQEISKFIKQELNSGKGLNAIKKSLLDAGHDKSAIELSVLEIEKHKFKKFSTKDIPNDAERQIINALEVFIKEQIKSGIKLEKIIRILKDYGHSEHLVIKALDNVKNNIKTGKIKLNQKKTRHFPSSEELSKEHVLLTGIISIIMLVVACASIIDESIFLIFIGFLPTIATLLIGYYYSEKIKEKIFLVPFISGTLFYMLGFILPVIKNMEYGNLSITNMIFSIIVALLFFDKKKNNNDVKNNGNSEKIKKNLEKDKVKK